MKNLIKVILKVVILTVMFIQVYSPLMSESKSNILNTKAGINKKSLSKSTGNFNKFQLEN